MSNKPVEIVIATKNTHKFRELGMLLKTKGFIFTSLSSFPDIGKIPERGKTFEENAVFKALEVAKRTGHPSIADDSGIEVDFLGGAPGVRSARFSGKHGDDVSNNKKLLKALYGVSGKKRSARYRCVLALASHGKLTALAKGTMQGRIASEPEGGRGFGYDPIFYIPRLGKTVAQISLSSKNKISHRAQAALRMKRKLEQIKNRMARTDSVLGLD